MSYTVCPKCNHKVLSVATRCPACGLALEAQFLGQQPTTPRSRRARAALLTAGIVLALFLMSELVRRLDVPARTAERAVEPPATLAQAPTPPPPVTTSRVSPRPAAASQDTALQAEPEAPPPPPPARAEAAPTVAPRTAPAAVIAQGGELRYATTWVNVRAEPRISAGVIGILKPGEAVQAGSLARGWYRVWSDRQAPGYVDRRLLDSVPQ